MKIRGFMQSASVEDGTVTIQYGIRRTTVAASQVASVTCDVVSTKLRIVTVGGDTHVVRAICKPSTADAFAAEVRAQGHTSP